MKKILLIEDNFAIRENIAEILELEGYKVIEAINGREGLEKAKKTLPDLILCDILMPEVNGHDVLIQLKQDEATSFIPFIFITASTEKKEIQIGLDLGASAYIRKPFEPSKMIDEIKRCLEGSKLTEFE